MTAHPTLRAVSVRLLTVTVGIVTAALALLLQVGAVALWIAGLIYGLWLHRWHSGYLMLVFSPVGLGAATQVHRYSRWLYERTRPAHAPAADVWDDPRIPSS